MMAPEDRWVGDTGSSAILGGGGEERKNSERVEGWVEQRL